MRIVIIKQIDSIQTLETGCRLRKHRAKAAPTKERKSDRGGEKHRLQDNEEIRPYFSSIEM